MRVACRSPAPEAYPKPRFPMLETIRHTVYRTRLKALEERNRAVRSDGPQLSVDFTCPTDMFAEVWDLFGDGRSVVDGLTRKVILASLLEDSDLDGSMGTLDLVCEFAERASGIDASAWDALDPNGSERALLEVFHRYTGLIEERGLIEPGQAISLIKGARAHFDIGCAEPLLLDEPMNRFFDGIPSAVPEGADACGIPEGVDLDIIALMGPSIRQSALLDAMACSLDAGKVRSIAVATADALDAFDGIAGDPRLSSRAALRLIARIPLSSTVMGRFLYAMQGMMRSQSRAAFIAFATDIALSPYGGIPHLEREGLSTLWLLDRTLGAIDIERRLAELSPVFGQLRGILSGDSRDMGVFDELRSVALSRFDGTSSAIESAAVSQLERLVESALELDAASALIVDIALSSNVPVSVESASHPKEATITVMDPHIASQQLPRSFDAVYLDDVSASAFNAKEATSSVEALLARLGCSKGASRMDIVKARFDAIVSSAAERLCAIHSLHDRDGADDFTSFVFDGLVARSVLADGLDGDIVSHLLDRSVDDAAFTMVGGGTLHRTFIGEEHLQRGVARATCDAVDILRIDRARRGSLGDGASPMLLSLMGDAADPKPVLSASALEDYLNCPYRWFIQKRLRLASIEEGLGSLERGTFLHRVLELFYRAVIDDPDAQGALYRCSDGWIEGKLHDAYEAALGEQRSLAPTEARYIPITEVERIEDIIQRRALLESVRALKQLPEEFSCSSIEFEIDAKDCADRGIDYAGAYLNGKIDRIDRSSDGSKCYVLDYKGSIRDHAAGSDAFELVDPAEEGGTGGPYFADQIYPEHIQTLIYATMYERLEDPSRIEPSGSRAARSKSIGALYASYRNTSGDLELSGSCSAEAPALLAASARGSAVEMDFDGFLHLVEGLISHHVDRMKSADIATSPHDEDACRFCVYRDCEARL